MKCRLCERGAEGELCRYHGQAEEAVRSAYPAWEKAFGTLGMKEYLERLGKNPETGKWAGEVAKLMLSELD